MDRDGEGTGSASSSVKERATSLRLRCEYHISHAASAPLTAGVTLAELVDTLDARPGRAYSPSKSCEPTSVSRGALMACEVVALPQRLSRPVTLLDGDRECRVR